MYPSGNLTFLFTDIVGSTRMWERTPVQMEASLHVHNQLLRESIESNRGAVYKLVGDAFCAVFTRASDAISAAVAIRNAIDRACWTAPATIEIRTAIHTGQAEYHQSEKGGEYFGHCLNRISRMLSATHGGQVILSRATADLVRDGLTEDVELIDLGMHYLKDLERSEHIFQLSMPGWKNDFPALLSLNNWPNNLPPQGTPFIGRAQQLDEVISLVKESRIVTIKGHGGAGKTRLALEVAVDLVDQYPDGAWLVDLSAIQEPAFVLTQLASVFDITEAPVESLKKAVTTALHGRKLLLVVDNCEHVLDDVACLVAWLHKTCPSVRFLCTSQIPLSIYGEHVYTLKPMYIPPEVVSVHDLRRSESVQLFQSRARMAGAQFALTEANAPHVAHICRRTDGIPLAIELAAASVRSMPIDQLAKRLDARLDHLTDGRRDGHSKHKTLKALVEWSFDLLSPSEQLLLCRLSIFAGGWSLEGSEAVCTSGPLGEIADVTGLLGNLVDKSLVTFEEGGGSGRYRLLATVRKFAHDRLVSTPDHECIQIQYRRFIVDYARNARGTLQIDEELALSMFQDERDNIRDVLQQCLSNPEFADEALKIVISLGPWWEICGAYSEASFHFSSILDCSEGRADSKELADVINMAGTLARRRHDLVAAREFVTRAMEMRQRLGLQDEVAGSLVNLSAVELLDGKFNYARELAEMALAINRRLGNRRNVVRGLIVLGDIDLKVDGPESAIRRFQEARTNAKTDDYLEGIAYADVNLALQLSGIGRFAEAAEVYEEALTVCRDLGHRQLTADIFRFLGQAALRAGFLQASALSYSIAARLQAELCPLSRNDQSEYDSDLSMLRAELSASEFRELWVMGSSHDPKVIARNVIADLRSTAAGAE